MKKTHRGNDSDLTEQSVGNGWSINSVRVTPLFRIFVYHNVSILCLKKENRRQKKKLKAAKINKK